MELGTQEVSAGILTLTVENYVTKAKDTSHQVFLAPQTLNYFRFLRYGCICLIGHS